MPRPLFQILFAAALAVAAVATCADELPVPGDKPLPTGRSNHKSDPAPVPASSPQAALEQIDRLVRSEDFAGALALLRPLLEASDFGARPAEERQHLHRATGWLAARSRDLPLARDQFSASIAAGSTSADDWFWLTLVQMDLGDREAAAQAMADFVRRWPDQVDRLLDRQIWSTFNNARADGPAAEALLEALHASGWRRVPLGGADELWRELALRRLARGDIQGAREVAGLIKAPIPLVHVRADRRFDALVDRDAPALDVGRAAARHATELRLQALLAPGRLDVLLAQLTALRVAGEFEEALAICEDAIARLAAAPAGQPPFIDAEKASWLGDERSRLLLQLGRNQEATEQLLAASRLQEDGAANISQVLNLALHHLKLGDPEAARRTLDRVGQHISPYGYMVKASAELRIALAQEDVRGARTALAYLREHREDSPVMYLEALVASGELDLAARILGERLASESARADALFSLQQLRESPPLPGETEFHARWQALVAREDVQAAVARVGRIEQHPIHPIH